jgi:predicted ATPase with chaperone activity
VSTVGFPDSTVRESRDRLRSALRLARSGDERKHFKSKRLNGEKKS